MTTTMCAYADSQDAAERTRAVVQEAMTQHGITGELSVRRWHPLEERWEDASVPLPASESERAVEHARLEEEETEESRRAGFAEWEVRVTCRLPGCARFAERLRGEGIPVNQRWRHLLVGANDEDDAAALAERLRTEAPAGSEILTEGSGLRVLARCCIRSRISRHGQLTAARGGSARGGARLRRRGRAARAA